MELVDDELIRMLSLHTMSRKNCLGKILEIERDDDVSPPLDRGRQDVAIIRIWKLQARNKRLVPRHKTIRHTPVHQISRAL